MDRRIDSGDPTTQLLGRVSLNPIVHADLIGTIVFPLLASIGGIPLIGWSQAGARSTSATCSGGGSVIS